MWNNNTITHLYDGHRPYLFAVVVEFKQQLGPFPPERTMSFRGGRDWDNQDRRYGNSGNVRGQVRRREDDELGWDLANKRRRYDVQTFFETPYFWLCLLYASGR